MQQTSAPAATEFTLTLPAGLLGFEDLKQWTLTEVPDEAPFVRVQATAAPAISFLALPPAVVLTDYAPELPAADVAELQLQNVAEAGVLNLVTLPAAAPPTINLKGPIVFNRRTRLAKQIVPVNAAAYDVQHPLPVAS